MSRSISFLSRRHLQPALHRRTEVEPCLHVKKAVEADELARFVKANEERTLRAAVAHVRQAGCRTAVP